MAAWITYKDRAYCAEPGETVLDCLARNGVAIPHSCCAGVCQSCLMQATEGEVPPLAQKDLKPALRQQNFFLACQCAPEHDVTVALPDAAGLDVPATVLRADMLNHNVMRLVLAPQKSFPCEPGQYLTLMTESGIARSYSIANDPNQAGHIELHIRLLARGLMSGFLKDNARTGLAVSVRGPAGHCFYVPEGAQDYPIFLAGTGTGLAPLLGIARRAIASGHRGEITLFHGALHGGDLYMVADLQGLAARHPNLRYRPCVLNGDGDDRYTVGNIEDVVLAALPADKAAVRLFLCGAPEFVNSLRRKAFIKGLASRNILADAFLTAKPATAAA